MKIAIIGAGAMGCLLASYLSAKHQVWLIDSWQVQVDTINNHGLTCERDGIHTHTHPQATTHASDVVDADVALVLVKYHQTGWAAQQASQVLSKDGICVTLQNGIGGADVLAQELGTHRVTRGVTSLGATLLGAGMVRHAGMGDTVFADTVAPHIVVKLQEAFVESSLPAHMSSDLDALVWGKLVVNVAINALTGILRVHNGIIASHPGATAIARAAVAEAVQVAEALAIRLPYDDAIAHALAVAHATGANRSSTLQDVIRGSPSEIATINGAVVRHAEQLGVPVPVNQLLVELMEVIDTTAAVRIT
ncbi:MAG: ketopantoate reductase family protein [Roseiflexaceae bacterium]